MQTARSSGASPKEHSVTSLGPSRTRDLILAVAIFVIAFLPRAHHLVSVTAIWHERAGVFLSALRAGDLAHTWLSPHPGVTVLWLAAAARWVVDLFADFSALTMLEQMSLEQLPLALLIALALSLTYLLLARIFDQAVAIVCALLMALSPMHIYVSKILHPDALVSVLMLLSALFLFRYSAEQAPRYLVFSGALSGLALLSKTPSFFMIPYFGLWFVVWFVWQEREEGRRAALSLAFLRRAARSGLRVTLLWAAPLIAVFILLWPAMWVAPLETLRETLAGTLFYQETAHENPLFFLGRVTTQDPGLAYYLVTVPLKMTVVTLPLFLLSLVTLGLPDANRYRSLVLWLSLSFALFFILQMTLGEKKFTRYALPGVQFLIILGGYAAVRLARGLFGRQKTVIALSLGALVVLQGALSLAHHPYYDTYYNQLFGSPPQILASGLVPGQEEGEGLEEAADYLNSLPFANLLEVGAHNTEGFARYFKGQTKTLLDDDVDYLVFTRNWIIRGMRREEWGAVWEAYEDRQAAYVYEHDGVPYVWVYKSGPPITEETVERPLEATVGDAIRLLGYDLKEDAVAPGQTLHLTLYWEAQQAPQEDYTVFAHLLGPQGQLQAQRDSQPQQGLYPTYLWQAGERVADQIEIELPTGLAPGTYALNVGMYTLADLQRATLTLPDGSPAPDNSLRLAEVEVR